MPFWIRLWFCVNTACGLMSSHIASNLFKNLVIFLTKIQRIWMQDRSYVWYRSFFQVFYITLIFFCLKSLDKGWVGWRTSWKNRFVSCPLMRMHHRRNVCWGELTLKKIVCTLFWTSPWKSYCEPSRSMDWFLYDNGLHHERVKLHLNKTWQGLSNIHIR